jgi:hypothetical protein
VIPGVAANRRKWANSSLRRVPQVNSTGLDAIATVSVITEPDICVPMQKVI